MSMELGRIAPSADPMTRILDGRPLPSLVDLTGRSERASRLILVVTIGLGRPRAVRHAQMPRRERSCSAWSARRRSGRCSSPRSSCAPTASPSWTATQRDPFVAFAAAMLLLVAPHLTALAGSPTSHLLYGYEWLTGCLAAAFGAAAFLITIRDLTPGRALDALFLAAIGATTAGLVAWMAVVALVDADVIGARPPFELLGLVVLDLCVVGLGLQAVHLRAGGRRGGRLFLLAWTFVLVADVSDVLADVTELPLVAGPMLAVGLLVHGLFCAAALQPRLHASPPSRSTAC